MSLFPLKPTHKPVLAYYAALAQFHQDGHKTEGNTRSAFADLLKKCASPYDWHLVEEYQFKGTNKQPLRADGALVDSLTLRGIPPAAFDYRLGNRSALEWIIDQYRVSTDPRSGITNDPNPPEG